MLYRILVTVPVVFIIIIALGWLGFRFPSPAFPAPDISQTIPLATQHIPQDLPAPIERFARAVYGDALPSAQSAIISGRAEVTINGITMPARFRFYYDMAHGHYHDIQVTWYTTPIMAINERYLDGQAIIDIPIIGRTDNQPHTNAASNQGFWAELIAWLPALALADNRVQWEAIDANSARMIVPNATNPEESFILTFDPITGYLDTLTAQRYQDENGDRHQWQPRALEWRVVDGTLTMARSSISWDQDMPWVVWEIDHVTLNTDVSTRLAHFG